MKKSVVATSAWLSFKRQTAASSLVSVPTIRFAKAAACGMADRISRKTPGESLHPHPPPWASEVRGGSGVLILPVWAKARGLSIA